MQVAPLHAQVIAWTAFRPPPDVPWETDAAGGQALAEFAGRACYQSWSKPNPVTATNAGYLAHILDVGHLSVLEHGTVTFYLTGVSRSFTHELVRHRHFSYSQLSQRYVDSADVAMVEPAAIAADPALHKLFEEAADAAVKAYSRLVEKLEDEELWKLDHRCRVCSGRVRYGDEGPVCFGTCGRLLLIPEVEHAKLPTAARKAARQAARAVLPNAAETRIVVTGNYRAWMHFIDMRATEHADVEIREGAIAVLRELQRFAPNIFGHYTITRLADGTEVAARPGAEQV